MLNIIVVPKDKDTILWKSGVKYGLIFNRVDCYREYIGNPQEHLVKDSKNISKLPYP